VFCTLWSNEGGKILSVGVRCDTWERRREKFADVNARGGLGIVAVGGGGGGGG